MRALCTADQHLGQGVRGSLTDERLQEQEVLWAATLRLARDSNVDAVLHGGDLLHDRKPAPAVMLAAERPLVEHLAADGPPIIMVNGNHCVSGTARDCAIDVFAEAGLIELHRRPGVTYADPGAAFPGPAICCLPWASVAHVVSAHSDVPRHDLNAYASELLIEAARGLRASITGPAILLTHFPVLGAALPNGLAMEHANGPMLSPTALAELGFDMVVLGDIHRPQFLDEEQRMLYVGSPQPLSFGEAGFEHGVWIVGFDGDSLETDFVRLDSRPFVTLDCDGVSLSTAGPRVDLCLFDEDEDVADAYVKVRYEATAEQQRRIDRAEIERTLLDAGAHRVWVMPKIVSEQRARVATLDETVSDGAALDLWLDAAGVNGDVAPPLRSLHRDYVEELTR